MIAIRKAAERGKSSLGWLDSRHTFSFSDYVDPSHMGFRTLRVINEDRVAPGQGFGTHGHRDMEILSYVLEGELEHRDSMGNGSIIRPGDVQRMTAGTGVMHSERNPSRENPVHFLQIWLLPEKRGLTPGYEQKTFAESERRGKLRLVASRDGREGSIVVHQDVALWSGVLDAGGEASLDLAAGRQAWVQVARGELELNGKKLVAGDGAAVNQESKLTLRALSPSEVLVFDLA